MGRKGDGSAGDADYGRIGTSYSGFRQPDPRIAKRILQVLGDTQAIVNVGAGAGSYEPVDRDVTPVEPSETMRAQRPKHLARAVDATAEKLPFADGQFDASMTTFSVHQWSNLSAGLAEMRRVSRGPAVVLSCDPDALDCFWLSDYAPEVIATEARRYPPIDVLAKGLGGNIEVIPVPIPLDCHDGFNEAYYGRPEMLLKPEARLSCSAWSFVAPQAVARFVHELSRDLADGAWDAKYGSMRNQPELEGSLRLIVSRPG